MNKKPNSRRKRDSSLAMKRLAMFTAIHLTFSAHLLMNQNFFAGGLHVKPVAADCFPSLERISVLYRVGQQSMWDSSYVCVCV